MMLCLRKGAKVCGKRTLYFYRFYKGIQCNRCGGITGKERVRFSAGELWTTDYKWCFFRGYPVSSGPQRLLLSAGTVYG